MTGSVASIASAPPGGRPMSTRSVLSKEEVEALLRPDLSDLDEPPARPAAVKNLPDLETTERADVARGQIQAKTAAASLALRQTCGIDAALRLIEARRGAFADVGEAFERGGAAVFFGDGAGVRAVLALDAKASAALVCEACGGDAGAAGETSRALTRLDAAVLAGLFEPLGAALGGLTLLRVETSLQAVDALAPPGAATVAELGVAVGDLAGQARLALSDTPARPVAPDPAADGLHGVLTARLASLTVPVSRLAGLKPGATLLLGVPADQKVDLLSGGRSGPLVAQGDIGRRGGRIAVRVSNQARAFGESS